VPDYDAVVVGSGAGGGEMAFRLSSAGKRVALIEAGGSYNTDQFTRFEAEALRNLWWEPRFTSNYELSGGKLKDEVALGMGRCVGGSTTIFTAIAFRAFPENIEQWTRATGVTNGQGLPLTFSDLVPSYEKIERETSVRKYTDWDVGVQVLQRGFTKLGLPLQPVDAFINLECDHSGCLFGCPTGAKRGSLVSYIIPALYNGAEIFPNSYVTEVLLRKSESGAKKVEAYGVKLRDSSGNFRTITGKVVVLAAGALETPQILMRSRVPELVGYTESSKQIGRNLAVNTATLVMGRFEEVLNNWEMHPLSAHLSRFALEKDGGFLLEASEVMEGPIGLSQVLVDEDGAGMIGKRLNGIMKEYKRMAGIFINIHDSNDGAVVMEEGPEAPPPKLSKPVTDSDLKKLEKARDLSREAMTAAGAKETYNTILLSHHVQGTCRMGEDRRASVVDSKGELHDVSRLFVSDGSLIPTVVDVNPSLTIYALADRVASHLLSPACSYLS
jgi:choline dehydrogenase-like flavoprotein